MGMGMNTIKAMIFALVLAIVGLALYPTYAKAADSLKLQFQARCQLGERDMIRLHDADGTKYNLGRVAGTDSIGRCGLATSTLAVNSVVENEQDETVPLVAGTAAAGGASNTIVTGGLWKTLDLPRFASVNILLANILPMMIAIGFVAAGASVFFGGGAGGMSIAMIGQKVMLLVTAVVAVHLLPVLVDFLVIADGVGASGNLTVTSQFNSITTLIFSVVPTLATVGILTLSLYQSGSELYGRARGSKYGRRMARM